MSSSELLIGLAQIAPVWLDRDKTLARVMDTLSDAKSRSCALLCFGEALVPGYPYWPDRTDGARFNSELQKSLHAHYVEQAVQIESGHLDQICQFARDAAMAVILGVVERPLDRGSHSLYASAVYVDQNGRIGGVHRKLVPTYEERLVWSSGDGHGLRVHELGAFHLGTLNCWENWMPLPRAALYAQGEDLHFALWPGSLRNTSDITRFIAREGRSYVASVANIVRASDMPSYTPYRAQIVRDEAETFSNGGTCLCGPDGEWILEPMTDTEQLRIATIDHRRVLEERQNFDPVGHYSRPDVVSLVLDQKRQSTLSIAEE